MGLIRAILRRFGRRNEPARPDPIREADADLVRQDPAYSPPPERKPEATVEESATVDAKPGKPKIPKSPLVALVGASAAIALATMIAKDESGRTVEATVTEAGELQVRHIRGRQFLEAYADIVGVPTICDGDTHGVRLGMRETEEGCTARLERQLVNHARPVLRCVPALARPEREQQLIASVSLAYNIGPGRFADRRWQGGFCGSTAARRFNAGDWRGGCDAFLMWNRAGGQVVRGLTLRRERERAICLQGL